MNGARREDTPVCVGMEFRAYRGTCRHNGPPIEILLCYGLHLHIAIFDLATQCVAV